jgi:hypothetical protein
MTGLAPVRHTALWAANETTLNNTNEVSSKFEFSHFDFLCKAIALRRLVLIVLRSQEPVQGCGRKQSFTLTNLRLEVVICKEMKAK